MFNKKFVNVLCKISAIGLLVVYILSMLVAIGLSSSASFNVVDGVGLFVGIMSVYTVLGAFLYTVIATMYKYNNAK